MHSFRRLSATQMSKIGGLEASKKLLGHLKISTTSAYIAQISDEKFLLCVENLSGNLIETKKTTSNEESIRRIVSQQVKNIFSDISSKSD